MCIDRAKRDGYTMAGASLSTGRFDSHQQAEAILTTASLLIMQTVAQLLAHPPFGSRMGGDVEMDDRARRSWLITKKHYSHRKCSKVRTRWKKVHRGEDFTMVTRKRQPLPAGVIRTGFAPGHVSARLSVRGMSKPSFASSQWILGAPQEGFSFVDGSVAARISMLILRRPVWEARERNRQYSRNPGWRQPTTVSGFTTTIASLQPSQSGDSATQNSRSRRLRCGRGCWRLSMAICCRRARISRPRSWRERRKLLM